MRCVKIGERKEHADMVTSAFLHTETMNYHEGSPLRLMKEPISLQMVHKLIRLAPKTEKIRVRRAAVAWSGHSKSRTAMLLKMLSQMM